MKFQREKAEVEEIATRISEWMENVKKQFKEQLKEEIATSQVMYLLSLSLSISLSLSLSLSHFGLFA